MADMKKVAMVTGAGSGVGKATVLALAAEGYACVLAGRRKEPIEAVAAEIAGNGGEAIAVSADVKAPRSSSTSVTGSRRSASPTAAGIVRKRMKRRTRETVATRPAMSSSATMSASRGKAAVESAIPNRASGSWATKKA